MLSLPKLTIKSYIIIFVMCTLFLFVALSAGSFWSLTQITNGSQSLAKWIETEERLTDNIVTPVITVEENFEKWIQSGREEHRKALDKSVLDLSNNVKNLPSSSAHRDMLKKVAASLSRPVASLEALLTQLERYAGIKAQKEALLRGQCKKIERALSSIMNKQIDPMRARAMANGDMTSFAQASQIDMLANEQIIQPIYKNFLLIENYFDGKIDASEVDRGWKNIMAAFTRWQKLVKSTPIASSANEIGVTIKGLIETWDECRKAHENLINTSKTFSGVLNGIIDEITSSISKNISEEKYKDVAKIKATSNETEETFMVLVAIGLMVLCLMAYSMISHTVKPLRYLSNELREMAVGAADLTKELHQAEIDCSSMVQCGKTSCPCYGKESHCWYEAGSYAEEIHCPRILTQEISSCDYCDVFRKAVVTEVDEVSTFINAFRRRMRILISRMARQTDTVENESKVMSQAAGDMSQAATDVKHRAAQVQDAAKQADDGVNTVVTAMEQMSNAVIEVANNTGQASHIANEARNQTLATDRVIQDLAESAQKIGQMSNLIGSIAEQTNLLALNATIEAARAGEAGKGFAVVANEVKELAKQTSESVHEIDEIVQNLQNNATDAKEATAKIVETIGNMADISDTIAAAVEEQTATTNEINESSRMASGMVQQMAGLSEEIAQSGEAAEQGAHKVRDAALKLDTLSHELQDMVHQFKL